MNLAPSNEAHATRNPSRSHVWSGVRSAAAEEVIQMLKDDAGKTKDEEELLEGELASAASEQGLAGASDSDEEPEDSGLDTSACDSSRDSWWRPARYNYGDIEVTSWVEDENGNELVLYSGYLMKRR